MPLCQTCKDEPDKPSYMSETEAPPGQSEPDKHPNMSETMASPGPCEPAMLSESVVKTILLECHYNWLEFRDRLAYLLPNISQSQQNAFLQKVYTMLDHSSDDFELVKSYLAAEAVKADQAEEERLARAMVRL